jgi:thiamine-monophosphate kinase
MSRSIEQHFIAALQDGPLAPAARGLGDDGAVLHWPVGLDLVATHDMLVEGVHYRRDCPPEDVAWKLVAVNYSDLAAMLARPVAVLLGAGFGRGADDTRATGLAAGLRAAIAALGGHLVGGDTVRTGGPEVLALTALGSVPPATGAPRSGAGAGDELWVSGSIGDAGLGLRLLDGRCRTDPATAALLVGRYRRPTPRLELGLGLRGVATAAIDVSDGLLLDASRLGVASGLRAEVRLADLPLSNAARVILGPDPDASALIELATAGDDYELLFAVPPGRDHELAQLARGAGCRLTRIGHLSAAGPSGVAVLDAPLPERLGWMHR